MSSKNPACVSAVKVGYLNVLKLLVNLQDWGSELFSALQKAGGSTYSNYAVGFNNVDVPAATSSKISVGNTPGKPWHGKSTLSQANLHDQISN